MVFFVPTYVSLILLFFSLFCVLFNSLSLLIRFYLSLSLLLIYPFFPSVEIESTSLRSSSVSSVPGATAKSMEAVSGSPPHGHHQWKLRHVDFMPKLVKEKTMSDDEYEKFP